jgi:hypothetical protein
MAVARMKNVEIGELDLASRASIDRFAREFLGSNRPLDLLINNLNRASCATLLELVDTYLNIL